MNDQSHVLRHGLFEADAAKHKACSLVSDCLELALHFIHIAEPERRSLVLRLVKEMSASDLTSNHPTSQE